MKYWVVNSRSMLVKSVMVCILSLLSGLNVSALDPGFCDVPREHVRVHADSVFTVVAPNSKVVLKYCNFHSKIAVTLYADGQSRLMIAATETAFLRAPRVKMDTVLLSTDGFQKRYVEHTLKNGETERYKVYMADAKDILWKYECSEIGSHNILIGTDFDENGTWTKLHLSNNGSTMMEAPTLTRQISYALTPEETAMLNAYDRMRSEIDAGHSQLVTIGLVLLLIGAVIAVYTLRSTKMSDTLRPRLAGLVSGPIAIVGFYMVFDNLNALLGGLGAGVAGIIFILLMALYFRRIIVMLEDNEKLSNSQVYGPFVFAKIGLLFVGWMVGALLFHIWWAALITVAVFAIPIFAVPDRGERCSRCHKVGAIEHTENEFCGFRIESKREGNYMVTRKWRRIKELRRCKYCGYQYYMPEKDGAMEWERYEELAPAPVPRKKSSASTPPDPEIGDIRTERVYASHFDCFRYSSDSKECSPGLVCCEYNGNQFDCPYFMPSGKYIAKVKEQIQSRNKSK